MVDATGTLTVQTLGFWHAGGGLGGDFGADAVVRKEDGLPIVPGRHLLGLIAHKLNFLSDLHAHTDGETGISPAVRDFLRGAGADDEGAQAKKRHRFKTTAGALLMSSARMSDAWRGQALSLSKAQLAPLYRRFGSTALEDGVAKDRTLRHIEVTVPMTLSAPIQLDLTRGDASLRDAVDVTALKAAVAQAVGLVQHIGRHRTRGLGRARLSVEWGSK